MTTYAGTAHNLDAINLAGGTLAGDPHPLSGYGDYTLNGTVSADATAGTSTISAAGGLNLRGNITFDVSSGNGKLLISAPIHNEPSIAGAITKTGSGLLVLSGTSDYSGGTTVSAGTLAVDGSISGSVNVNSNATLSGNGQIDGSVTVFDGGILSPGDRLGVITMQLLTLNGTSQTNIELGGRIRGSQYDAVISNSLMRLEGTLNVSLANGFLPIAGDSFDIFDWGTLTANTFSTVNLPTLGGRIVWNASQLYTTGTISVVATYLAGDFNRDGHVDVADILAMEQALADLPDYETAKALTDAQLQLIGDINGDHQLTNADLQALIALVANNFVGGSSLAAVPEPATLTLSVVALSVFAIRRLRTRSAH